MLKSFFVTLSIVSILSQSAFAEEKVIIQKDKAFSAKEITIKVGDKITFKNEDTVVHNIFTSSDTLKIDAKVQKKGESSSVPFPNEGEGEIRCAIHPQMKIKVKVIK